MAEPVVPRCHIPWQEMNVDADGNVTPCCNWKSHNNVDNPYCGDAKKQTLAEIWNGPVYRNLRKHMAAGDLEKAGCAKCILIVRGQESPLRCDQDAEAEFATPEADQSAYARNLATLKREIAAGADVLEAKPTVLSVTPSYACNIRCVHCFQEPLRSKDMDSPPLFKEMLELSDSMSFIQCGGGEPLLLPLWKEFLSHVNLEKNPYLTFATCTNATVVTDATEAKIRQFKNVNIGVSLDAGSKDVYERVRLRGKFDDVDRNLDRLAAIARSKPASVISISMSVMRDNFTDLANFFAYATSKGVTASLSPVMAMPSDQAITCLREPHMDLRLWRAMLAAAERTVRTIDLSSVIGGPARLFRDENDAWLRDNYLKQIDFVRQQIPWQLENEVHVEVLDRIPGPLQHKLAGATVHLIIFSPVSAPINGPARHFAPIDGETYLAFLPPGAYRVGIIPRHEWPRYEAGLQLEIDGNGQATWRHTLASGDEPGLVRSGLPICSSSHDVYHVSHAFEPTTNCWVSAEVGAEMDSRAFIGIDAGNPISVRSIRVKWPADYATPKNVIIECSDDGDSWQFVERVETNPQQEPSWQTIPLGAMEQRRHWRLLAGQTRSELSQMGVMELKFYDC